MREVGGVSERGEAACVSDGEGEEEAGLESRQGSGRDGEVGGESFLPRVECLFGVEGHVLRLAAVGALNQEHVLLPAVLVANVRGASLLHGVRSS